MSCKCNFGIFILKSCSIEYFRESTWVFLSCQFSNTPYMLKLTKLWLSYLILKKSFKLPAPITINISENKLKSLKVTNQRKDEWRMTKDEWTMMNDERWMMKNDDFKLLKGFADGLTDRQTFLIVELLLQLKSGLFKN